MKTLTIHGFGGQTQIIEVEDNDPRVVVDPQTTPTEQPAQPPAQEQQ